MKCTPFFLCCVAYQNKKSEGSVFFGVMEPFCCQSGKNKLHCIPYEREQIPVALVALTRPQNLDPKNIISEVNKEVTGYIKGS